MKKRLVILFMMLLCTFTFFSCHSKQTKNESNLDSKQLSEEQNQEPKESDETSIDVDPTLNNQEPKESDETSTDIDPTLNNQEQQNEPHVHNIKYINNGQTHLMVCADENCKEVLGEEHHTGDVRSIKGFYWYSGKILYEAFCTKCNYIKNTLLPGCGYGYFKLPSRFYYKNLLQLKIVKIEDVKTLSPVGYVQAYSNILNEDEVIDSLAVVEVELIYNFDNALNQDIMPHIDNRYRESFTMGIPKDDEQSKPEEYRRHYNLLINKKAKSYYESCDSIIINLIDVICSGGIEVNESGYDVFDFCGSFDNDGIPFLPVIDGKISFEHWNNDKNVIYGNHYDDYYLYEFFDEVVQNGISIEDFKTYLYNLSTEFLNLKALEDAEIAEINKDFVY